MKRQMGESWYEDWDQVVEMACVSAPANSQHSFHEAHAWLEVFFDLSFFPERDQWIQLENLRRRVGALYSWLWGDRAEELLVVFDCESYAGRAHQLENAASIGFMGQIGHLPPLARINSADEPSQTGADPADVRKWLKDCCTRVKNRAYRDRDRILHRNFEVSAYHASGQLAYPFFEEAGLHATGVDVESVSHTTWMDHSKTSYGEHEDAASMEQAFEVFLAMLADEGFPVSAYQLDLALFKEAEQAFRASVVTPGNPSTLDISASGGFDL